MIDEKDIWKEIFIFIENNNLFNKVIFDVYNSTIEIPIIYHLDSFQGAFLPSNNTILIISNQHKDIKDLHQTLQHEIFGHFAINHLTPQQKNSLLNSISNESSSPFCDFKKIVDFINTSKDYKDKFSNQKAEEVFAFVAQDLKINLDHKFVPFENKIDGSTKEKMTNIIQNLAAGIRENKLKIQKENIIQKSQDKGMSR